MSLITSLATRGSFFEKALRLGEDSGILSEQQVDQLWQQLRTLAEMQVRQVAADLPFILPDQVAKELQVVQTQLDDILEFSANRELEEAAKLLGTRSVASLFSQQETIRQEAFKLIESTWKITHDGRPFQVWEQMPLRLLAVEYERAQFVDRLLVMWRLRQIIDRAFDDKEFEKNLNSRIVGEILYSDQEMEVELNDLRTIKQIDQRRLMKHIIKFVDRLSVNIPTTTRDWFLRYCQKRFSDFLANLQTAGLQLSVLNQHLNLKDEELIEEEAKRREDREKALRHDRFKPNLDEEHEIKVAIGRFITSDSWHRKNQLEEMMSQSNLRWLIFPLWDEAIIKREEDWDPRDLYELFQLLDPRTTVFLLSLEISADNDNELRAAISIGVRPVDLALDMIDKNIPQLHRILLQLLGDKTIELSPVSD